MNISPRERFKAIARFQRPGDLFYSSELFWPETLVNWIRIGAPSQLTDMTFLGQFFGYDHRRPLGEITSGLVLASYMVGDVPAFQYLPPIVPRFEQRVLATDDTTITLINQGGQTVKVFKNDPQKMPMYLDHPVKDRETWKEYKKRLDPDTLERWPADWQQYVEKINSRDIPVVLYVGSFFGFLREWMGLERLLYTFYDDPDLIEDMMDTMLHLELKVIELTTKDINLDFPYQTGCIGIFLW